MTSKWTSVFVAAVVAASFAASVQAQGDKSETVKSTCEPKNKKMDISSCPVMSKLNLTDEQKVKVQALCDKCNAAGGTKEACDQMTKDMEGVLTPEQLTQFKAACEEMKGKGICGSKAGKSGCMMKHSEKSVEETK
jgi:Spy/CpxP family protein refolding chaperone